ncbi:MAG TPA: hypothetical protein VEL75_07935 [Candidatus Methylomirabilis sp.]|nr:hypothetical protein [Candidatus Methylomirabilis sp.]
MWCYDAITTMRSTVRIDDDLFRELKERAHRESTSLTSLLNRMLRAGLQAAPAGGRSARRRRLREKTHSMGPPRVELLKALALAAGLEDEEALRKMAMRK